MFNRIDEYLENNNIICPEQKGFRKGMRTSDHIFPLQTIIDKYFKNNKYSFACFIDLKKAFDTLIEMLFFTKFVNVILEVIFSVSWKVCTRKYHFLLICHAGMTNTFETNWC